MFNIPVTSLFWCLSLLFLCCASDESIQLNRRNDMFNWWFVKIIKSVQSAIPLLGVWSDMPTYQSQSSVVWSNYWCCIHSNLLYCTTDCAIEPVVIKSVFLHLFIITMEFHLHDFHSSSFSDEHTDNIVRAKLKCDFNIPKVYLGCVFNLLLHFE